MIIVKEKQQFDEMAILAVSSFDDGLPFRVAIKSPDHQPPHAHVMDKTTGKKELGQFLISPNLPQKINDIKDYKQGISDEMRTLIFDWAKFPNKRFFGKINNWEALVGEWRGNEVK
jgi:hypothetical protein